MGIIGGGLGSWLGGAKSWLLGGKATQNMPSAPATAQEQQMHLRGLLANNAPTIDRTQSDETRGQQGTLAQMLMRQAAGQEAGPGELAVRRQANNAMANQVSMAQMSRGAGAGMAARNAARTNADIGTNAAGQAGIAQLQDQSAARGQLGGLLGGMRGQDIQTAGADQQAALAQEQIKLASLAQMLGIDQATLQQDLARRQLAAGDKGMLPSLLTAGGMIGGAMIGGPAGAAAGAKAGQAVGGG